MNVSASHHDCRAEIFITHQYDDIFVVTKGVEEGLLCSCEVGGGVSLRLEVGAGVDDSHFGMVKCRFEIVSPLIGLPIAFHINIFWSYVVFDATGECEFELHVAPEAFHCGG